MKNMTLYDLNECDNYTGYKYSLFYICNYIIGRLRDLTFKRNFHSLCEISRNITKFNLCRKSRRMFELNLRAYHICNLRESED